MGPVRLATVVASFSLLILDSRVCPCSWHGSGGSPGLALKLPTLAVCKSDAWGLKELENYGLVWDPDCAPAQIPVTSISWPQ